MRLHMQFGKDMRTMRISAYINMRIMRRYAENRNRIGAYTHETA